MIKLVLTLAAVLSCQAMAQGKFNNSVSDKFVTFDIVRGGPCVAGQCSFYDSNNNQRIFIFYSLTDNSAFYKLYDSNGYMISIDGGEEIDAQFMLSASQQLALATSECPIKVFINREKNKISDIQPSCIGNRIKKLVLVKRDDCAYGVCLLYGNDGTIEMYYRLSQGDYSLKGFDIGSHYVKLDSISTNRMAAYIQNMKPTCPLTIEYDFFSGKILEASLACKM